MGEQMKNNILICTLAALPLVTVPSVSFAHCGGAFCTINTNWDVQGVWDKPGVRLDLRAEFIDLDQLRKGSHDTHPAGIVDTHDETRTINRNFVGTLDWGITPQWGVTLRAPLVDRSHNHIHNMDNGAGGVEPEAESWNFTKVGDVQAVARYAFHQDPDGEAGVRFGLKLPTGGIHEKNSAGALAERSLQPGTGSTDALLGAYYHGRLNGAGWFVQGMWQQVINERDNFKPGRQLSLDVGMNYAATPKLSLLMQMNTLYKSKDTGANAEPQDSGNQAVFLSPGISYRVIPNLQVYGFMQKPIYQHMNGTQLVADWSAALGLSTQF